MTPSGHPRPIPQTRHTGLIAGPSTSRRVRRPVFHAFIIALAISTAFFATLLPNRLSTRADVFAVPGILPDFRLALQERDSPDASSISIDPLLTLSTFRGGLSAGLTAPQNNSAAETNVLNSAVETNVLQPLAEVASSSAGSLTSLCNPESALYCVYTISEGDTLSNVASKFGLTGNLEEDVTPHDLVLHSNRPDVISVDDLEVGLKLRIPLQNGVLHTVLSAQTLSEIADVYDVATAEITAVAENGIADEDSLIIGQEILVLNPKRFSSLGGSGGILIVNTGASSASGLVWPVSGMITSYFGPGHPLGIDIDLSHAPYAPVAAAAAGAVTFAGGNPCCSYGYYVVVDHGNGYSTLYAHFSSISVVVGQYVSQGQVLGYGGNTGYSTGNHVHFEVKYGGNVINPMNVLP